MKWVQSEEQKTLGLFVEGLFLLANPREEWRQTYLLDLLVKA